jgi:hypothetical protein
MDVYVHGKNCATERIQHDTPGNLVRDPSQISQIIKQVLVALFPQVSGSQLVVVV